MSMKPKTSRSRAVSITSPWRLLPTSFDFRPIIDCQRKSRRHTELLNLALDREGIPRAVTPLNQPLTDWTAWSRADTARAIRRRAFWRTLGGILGALAFVPVVVALLVVTGP